MKKLLSIIVLGLLLSGCGEKTSKLPILECIIENPNGSKTKKIYDLTEIERLDPTNNLNEEEYKQFIRRDGEWTSLNIFENEYRMNNSNISNKISRGYLMNINRETGVLEATIHEPYHVDLSFSDLLTVFARANTYNGVCEKKEKRNL